MVEPINCLCGACVCNIATRRTTKVCKRCTDGDHPGIERVSPLRQAPIPRHSRMYGQPCDVCGAQPGRKCLRPS